MFLQVFVNKGCEGGPQSLVSGPFWRRYPLILSLVLSKVLSQVLPVGEGEGVPQLGQGVPHGQDRGTPSQDEIMLVNTYFLSSANF